jgi:hypothetical protein
MAKPLFEDPVVAEIHAIRAQMLAECGGDHRKLMELVDEHERASGRKVIPVPPAMPARTKEPTPVPGIAAPTTAGM